MLSVPGGPGSGGGRGAGDLSPGAAGLAPVPGESSEETWLTRIAINVCKNELRSPWRRRRAPAEHLDTLAVEAPEAADDTLVRAVGHLPPKYREVIVLYYYREWSAAQIAQRLGLPVSTVTVRLSRARKMLYERLEGWYYGRA
nr:sigma-70 family RNA polymerase sigma factor [Flavonifractor sp. An135]